MSWNCKKEWARFFYVSGKGKTKLVVRKIDDKNQPTNQQTNQPTNPNQPTQINQPKPTQTNHFQLLQPCYLEAGCNFSGRCCHSLGWCTTSLPCLFLQRGCPPKGVGGGHLWRCWLKIPHNPRKLKECHLKKGNHFRRIGIFIYPTRIFQGDVRGVFGGVTWKADKEQPFEKGKIIWTKPPLVGFRKEYYNIIFQHGV